MRIFYPFNLCIFALNMGILASAWVIHDPRTEPEVRVYPQIYLGQIPATASERRALRERALGLRETLFQARVCC